MPMDAYREAGTFVVHLDLPGGSAEPIDLTVEQNVLTVHAERKPRQERAPRAWSTTRPYGVFSRQPFLGDTLDADRGSNAVYDTGVLTLTIPIAQKTKSGKGRDHQRLRAQADQRLTRRSTG